jgi:polysaccharide export outer membrane protein
MNVPASNSARKADKSSHRAANACRVLAACLLSGAALLLAGCQSPPLFYNVDGILAQSANQGAVAPPRLDARAANYATNSLQEGDVVSITFQYSTNFNAVQKITLDGVLNLETVGAVKAAGRTVVELQTELGRLYKPQVKNDVITVKLIASATSVYISGAVLKPGKVLMERPMTALEAIMEAGGFDPTRAKPSQVSVLRVEDGKQKMYRLNLKRALQGEENEPFYLKPYDIVHVPTKTFNF